MESKTPSIVRIENKLNFIFFSFLPLANRYDLNKLTPANLASLRWDNSLSDPTLEHERIERYKELRRQRYIDARQQTIEALSEQMQVTSTNETATLISTDQS